jgi:hypothetical protein
LLCDVTASVPACFTVVCAYYVYRDVAWQRIDQVHHNILQYADEGEDMLNRIVTGDESWVHHYQPESKRASMQWKHPSSTSTKKFKAQL